MHYYSRSTIRRRTHKNLNKNVPDGVSRGDVLSIHYEDRNGTYPLYDDKGAPYRFIVTSHVPGKFTLGFVINLMDNSKKPAEECILDRVFPNAKVIQDTELMMRAVVNEKAPLIQALEDTKSDHKMSEDYDKYIRSITVQLPPLVRKTSDHNTIDESKMAALIDSKSIWTSRYSKPPGVKRPEWNYFELINRKNFETWDRKLSMKDASRQWFFKERPMSFKDFAKSRGRYV